MNPQKIEFLPEHLIDQIKAGEVVERPANVLKELLENALDAGSDSIEIEIIENGMELIRVQDNGAGIPSDQIEMAFGRHATSKIKAFQDLYSLSTFGFRGEALPSIASISHIECASWTKENVEGVSLKISGAIVEAKHKVGKTSLEHGTIMSVRNLFYNTPARLKFLQSAQSEKNWIKKYFYSFVLSRPDVSFSLSWDNNDKKVYSRVATLEERIKQLFSAKSSLDIYQANKEWNGIECQVYFISTKNQRSDGPLQHVLINGRPVLDKAYQRITQQVLDKYFPEEQLETIIILKVPGDVVDVNVHPNKTVVKFFKSSDILSLVSATLSEALPKKTQTPLVQNFEPSWLQEKPEAQLRDRSLVYADHRESLNNSNLILKPTTDVSILHSSPGPYLIISDQQYEFPIYICGKSMLADWINNQTNTDRYPLLVSYPIKDIKLSASDIKELLEKGFEIDTLKDVSIVREIPMWATNLSLPIVVNMVLSVLKKVPVKDFQMHEISSHMWIKIYQETQSIDQKKSRYFLDPKKIFL